MGLQITYTDSTPTTELESFIETLEYGNEDLRLNIDPYIFCGRIDPTQRVLTLRSAHIELSSLLYRTTAVVVRSLEMRQGEAESVAILTVKLPN